MRNRLNETRVTVVLNGGLGNQFFQYFAGLYVAHRTKSRLFVDATFAQRGRTGHSDWIDVLRLPGMISKDAPWFSLNFLASMISRVTRALFASLFKSNKLRIRLLRQYRSPVNGFDISLDYLESPITILGYFQTWRYYKWLKDQNIVPEFRLNRPSEWFLETQKRLENEGKVLGLHFRRGDYVRHPQIGILSMGYYQNAILALRAKMVEWDAVWVFSDDTNITQEDVRGLFPPTEKLFFVKPPLESHSFESLSLMSKTSTLVIANSTFSWWAATLGDPQMKIVCPESWFAGKEDPVDLCPPAWIRAKSTWRIS